MISGWALAVALKSAAATSFASSSLYGQGYTLSPYSFSTDSAFVVLDEVLTSVTTEALLLLIQSGIQGWSAHTAHRKSEDPGLCDPQRCPSNLESAGRGHL